MTPLIQRLLRALSRPETSECALATGRFPAARKSDQWEALDEKVVSTDDILAILVTLGGDRHVDRLAEQPVQWSFRSRGVGLCALTATKRGDEVRARLVVRERENPVEAKPARKSGQMKSAAVEAVSPQPPPKVAPATIAAPTTATSITAALGELIEAARAASASDLHVIADRPVLNRIAGELAPRGEALSAERVEALLLPIVPERLRAELEKVGSCDFAFDDAKLGRARANVSRQRTGLKGCFRLIPREVPTLASLGLPEEVARATKHHQGLIVVTGPTGHGKTTTLAAIVDHINTHSTHHVITVEDPVEYIHPRKRAMMSQREVGTHTKSFARALKGALRQDPDVIVVGELRDVETVAMAVAASETGHLVIGTMNTPSAAKTIDRLIDMFPPGDQAQVRRTMAGGLKLIVGQRLVPSVDRKRVHAAVELLTGTVALWNLIREEKTYQIPSLQQRGRSLGIIRLDDSLAALVRAGKSTQEDAALFAESPETFALAVRGNVVPPPEPPAKPGFFGRKG